MSRPTAKRIARKKQKRQQKCKEIRLKPPPLPSLPIEIVDRGADKSFIDFIRRYEGLDLLTRDFLVKIARQRINQLADANTLTDFKRFLSSSLMRAVLNRIGEEERTARFPYSYAFTLFEPKPRPRLQVVLSSLSTMPSEGGTVYWSQQIPPVETKAGPLHIAFRRHSMERIVQRASLELGSVTGYVTATLLVRMNACAVPEELTTAPLGFSLFAICDPDPYGKLLCRQILDRDPTADDFYRVGYFPADRVGNVMAARTLLFPGMRNTPEHAYFQRARLPRQQFAEFRQSLERLNVKEILDEGDAQLLRWFHHNAVPQIVPLAYVLERSSQGGQVEPQKSA